jgi:hypothetical protein
MVEIPVEQVRQAARGAAREAGPWIEKLARAGYFARGVVYVIVAWIALQAALGNRRTAGPEGALTEVFRQPFGKALLIVLAAGLAGYALWRFVQALLDPERKGTDAQGLVSRAGYVLTGIIHALLTAAAVRMALGSGGPAGGDSEARERTQTLMEQPAGPWLVGLVGLGLAAYGLYQLYRAFQAKLGKRLDLSRMGPRARRAFVPAARAGLAARGVVFVLIGSFVVRAATSTDPGEARGVGGALESVRGAPYGTWLLGLVALGLAGYGIFEMVKARYRIIRPPT